MKSIIRNIYVKLCVIILIVTVLGLVLWGVSTKFKPLFLDFFQFVNKKEVTTAHVLGAFQKVSELYVYRENRANLFQYTDPKDKNRSLSAIIRYQVDVKFNTKEIRVETVNSSKDGIVGYKISMPVPIIEGYPKLGAGKIGDNINSDTLGVELIDSSGDFKLSEDDKLIKDFINQKIENGRKDIEKTAFEYTKEKIIKFCGSAGINILDVTLRTE